MKYFAPRVKTCSKYQLCEFGKDPGGIFEMLHCASKKFLISSSSASGWLQGRRGTTPGTIPQTPTPTRLSQGAAGQTEPPVLRLDDVGWGEKPAVGREE